ncbi:MAG TPA: CRISPR-associated endonuclease Cas2 [Phycisphaerae bacterium]|nr:CRISPR-associated endonuclease Cas2 [Phycisphaerae bacterium]
MRNRYLVAYDISDDKRRTAIFKALMANGDHVQFSVFLCDLSDMELAALQGDLAQYVNQRQDQVIFLDLGPAESGLCSRLQCLGQAYSPPTRCTVI